MSADNKNRARHRIVRGLATLFAIIALGTSNAEASTFLLQFGSFNSQDQANQKWDDIKSKNGDLVGKLTLHVAEVALPPDNTVMYRTQAGPLASHSQAASLCSTLQSRGVECFVVETALFTAEPLPEQAENNEPALPTLPPLTVTSPIAPEPAPAAPASVTLPPIPAPKAQATASVTPPAPPPMPSAVATTPAVATPTPPTATAETNKPGFFGRLFGKSSTTAAATPAPVVKPTPLPPAPPVPEPAPVPVPVANAEPEPIIYSSATASPVPAIPHPPAAPMVAPIATPPAITTTAETESVPFPIPPASKPVETIPAVQAAMPEPMPVPVPMASTSQAPVATSADVAAISAPSSSTAPDWTVPGRGPRSLNSEVNGSAAATPPAHPANSNVVGNVKVAEAIRVPLGSGKAKKVVILPPVHGLGGTPSATTNKTYWAQLSYFSDEQQARNFYDQFHSTYPQFSDGVRVRITRPYSSSESAGRVSLRVGPFAGTNDVQTICKAAHEHNVSCTVVRELGTSSSASTERTRTSYHNSTTQTVDVAPTESTPSSFATKYWLQLGSYRNPDDAWDEWKTMQSENKKLLRKVHADVSSPPMSSSQAAQFRLRAGPFTTEESANSLCDSLQDAGTSCIVVNDR